ncbi:Z1 domain-containing protein [Luteimicrobium sp. NPDC057192]|uniref:Z1 domain-containing protein n=1 Tax=Luteimicrobium sp. NPDC057192 TaxID=3346042 RepID=UPI00363B83C7
MTGSDAAPHGVEHVVLAPEPAQDSWWSAYATALDGSGIGAVSRAVIEADAEYIVAHGIFGDGSPSDEWPSSRVRRGLVMGAVQSGKTASMMAVTAKALDRGVDAVVVLAGTRTALWLQTFSRLVEQLDTGPGRARRRLLVPRRSIATGEELPGPVSELYGVAPGAASRALDLGRPLLVVAMKHAVHIEQLARSLHQRFYPLTAGRIEPFHVLVIDDEADDSSIVDASLEGSPDDLSVQRKQIPRRILDLWEDRRQPGRTANDRLYATYLAYTATPQANLLQDDGNPLAPKDFVASLRTPGTEGDPEVRTPSYRVPEGVTGWYTGGEIFYRTMDGIPLCVPTDDVADDDLVPDALRAYLVASAVRVGRRPGILGPATARNRVFGSKAEAQAATDVMSMLIHPASAKDVHFEVADQVVAWSIGERTDLPVGNPADEAGHRWLRRDGVEQDITLHPDRWLRWLESYGEAAQFVNSAFDPPEPRRVPSSDRWDEIRTIILDEIVPGTAVAVINSDENADDRPEFGPWQDAQGWHAPRNLSTIFVSGNVMSRGLTLDGLSTTLFTRRSNAPLADTQMQMQRWFGYRGKILDLCRVLTTSDQISLFAQYDQNDEALRRDILEAMRTGDRTPDFTILQGKDFRATGKISGLRSEPLFPGDHPFVRHMNPAEDDPNLALVADLFGSDDLVVGSVNAPRGLLLKQTYGLMETADLLDRMRYRDHGDDGLSAERGRWASLAHHAGLPSTFRLYRAPQVPHSVDLGSASPYVMAAYLRFWSECLTRRVPGVVSSDDPPVRWNLVDLGARRELQPRFRVGLRFGGGDPLTDGPLARLGVPVRPMERSLVGNDMHASWGSRNRTDDGIVGDELFDRAAPESRVTLTDDGARRPGSDGLLLFHVVRRESGRATIALGASIPRGGPDHVRARR